MRYSWYFELDHVTSQYNYDWLYPIVNEMGIKIDKHVWGRLTSYIGAELIITSINDPRPGLLFPSKEAFMEFQLKWL